MHVISYKIFENILIKNLNQKPHLLNGIKKLRRADWRNFTDMKKSFNSVDNVGNDRFVFNIKGNHYRIVAMVIFKIQKVYNRWVGNHNDYDKIKAINDL